MNLKHLPLISLISLSLACASKDDGNTGTGSASGDADGDADADGTASGEASGDAEASGSDADSGTSSGGSDSSDSSASSSGSGSSSSSSSEGGPFFDLPGGDGDGDCVMCSITLDSTQSGSLEALNGTTFLGEAQLFDQVIYALDEVGNGRVIYTADTNLLYNEITDCPLWEWLGATGDQLPKVLSFGRYLCDGVGNNLGVYPDLTYAGNNLPQEYVGDPAALKADYDAVIYCTLGSSLTQQEAQTIVDFVDAEGGGLYLASEYWGFINQSDLDAVNDIGGPLGVNFLGTNLDWGQADGEIEIECFPEPQ